MMHVQPSCLVPSPLLFILCLATSIKAQECRNCTSNMMHIRPSRLYVVYPLHFYIRTLSGYLCVTMLECIHMTTAGNIFFYKTLRIGKHDRPNDCPSLTKSKMTPWTIWPTLYTLTSLRRGRWADTMQNDWDKSFNNVKSQHWYL